MNFDDVTIRPVMSDYDADSRKFVDVFVDNLMVNSGRVMYSLPIFSSNMSCISTMSFSKAFERLGGLPCLHKFYEVKELVEYFQEYDSTFYTVGLREEDLAKLSRMWSEVQLKYICIDAPNGYIKRFYKTIEYVRKKFPNSVILAGNVITHDAAERVINCGADIVKLGCGSGQKCNTTSVTGVGLSLLEAIQDCEYAVHRLGGYLCADGGIKTSGDICKALIAGADYVMLGSMFGGVEENYRNGECEWELKGQCRDYDRQLIYGMSSKYAMEKHYGKQDDYRASEGNVSYVPYKGILKAVLQEILGGMRSCGTFVGAKNIKEMKQNGKFF